MVTSHCGPLIFGTSAYGNVLLLMTEQLFTIPKTPTFTQIGNSLTELYFGPVNSYKTIKKVSAVVGIQNVLLFTRLAFRAW